MVRSACVISVVMEEVVDALFKGTLEVFLGAENTRAITTSIFHVMEVYTMGSKIRETILSVCLSMRVIGYFRFDGRYGSSSLDYRSRSRFDTLYDDFLLNNWLNHVVFRVPLGPNVNQPNSLSFTLEVEPFIYSSRYTQSCHFCRKSTDQVIIKDFKNHFIANVVNIKVKEFFPHWDFAFIIDLSFKFIFSVIDGDEAFRTPEDICVFPVSC